MFISKDLGQSWEQNPILNNYGFGNYVTCDPVNKNVLYTDGGGVAKVAKSVDGGKSWKNISNGISNDPNVNFTGLVIDPKNAKRMIVGGGYNTGSIYKTDDGGQSWKLVLTKQRITDILLNPVYTDVVSVASEYGVSISKDFGETWADFHQGLPNQYVHDVEVHASNPNKYLAAVHQNGIYTKGAAVSVIKLCNPECFTVSEEFSHSSGSPVHIHFTLKKDMPVSLKLYNVRGVCVRNLVPYKNLHKGMHTISWDGTEETGSPVAKGTFYCHLTRGSKTYIKRVLYLK